MMIVGHMDDLAAMSRVVAGRELQGLVPCGVSVRMDDITWGTTQRPPEWAITSDGWLDLGWEGCKFVAIHVADVQ